MRWLFLVLSLLCITPAFGQHDHGKLSPEVARFYETWTMPDQRTASCCNRTDCDTRQVKQVAGVWTFFHQETNKWYPIPENRLEHNTPDPRDSPDGQPHVCANLLTGNVYCAVLGGGV